MRALAITAKFFSWSVHARVCAACACVLCACVVCVCVCVRARARAGALLRRYVGINRGGNASNMGCSHLRHPSDCIFNASHACDGDLALAACMFSCSGKADFVHGLSAAVTVDRAANWWSNTLKVPWAVFPSGLPKNAAGGRGWREWRLNLYRYDYGSSAPGCYLGAVNDSLGTTPHCEQEELSGWSASGEANFHTPQWFGSATLLDPEPSEAAAAVAD
eukprot:COSAG05_NODE_1044_length_6057_cov_9.395267_2_plen_219_part_00